MNLNNKILLVLFLEFKQEYYPEKLKLFRNKNLLIRWISYLSIILFIVLLGVFLLPSAFIFGSLFFFPNSKFS